MPSRRHHPQRSVGAGSTSATHSPFSSSPDNASFTPVAGNAILYCMEVAFQGDTEGWAQLLKDESDTQENWSEAELGAMLDHQLAAALEPELWVAEATPMVTPATNPAACTFRDAIFGQIASLESLRRINDYAWEQMSRAEAILPEEIARVLYYGSAMAARRFSGECGCLLSQARLKAGVNWVLAQEWIDPAIRDWFHASFECLS